MNNDNIYKWFFIAGAAVGIYGLFLPDDDMLDINLHNGYFVVAHSVLCIIAWFYITFCGMVYMALRYYKRRIRGGVVHLLLTAIPVWLMAIIPQFVEDVETTGYITVALALLFLAGQMLFPVNVLRSRKESA